MTSRSSSTATTPKSATSTTNQNELISQIKQAQNVIRAEISEMDQIKQLDSTQSTKPSNPSQSTDTSQSTKPSRPSSSKSRSKRNSMSNSTQQNGTMSTLPDPVRTRPASAGPRTSSRQSTASSINASDSGGPSFMRSTQSYASRSQTPDSRRKVARTKFLRAQAVRKRHHQQKLANQSAQPNPVHVKERPLREKIFIDVPYKPIRELSVIMGFESITAPNYKITSFEGLGIREDLKILFVQNNFITSFKYLGSQPNLELLQLSNNCIASCYALETQPKLKNIDLTGNLIAKHPHYRLMVLMCAGTHIKLIDNEPVKYQEREFAKKYIKKHPMVVNALRNGWLFDMRMHSEEEFQNITQSMESIDMDDRNTIRSSDEYQKLVSGTFEAGDAPPATMNGDGSNIDQSLLNSLTNDSSRPSTPALGRARSRPSSASIRGKPNKTSPSHNQVPPTITFSKSANSTNSPPPQETTTTQSPRTVNSSQASSPIAPIVDSTSTNNQSSPEKAPQLSNQQITDFLSEISHLKEVLQQKTDEINSLKSKTKQVQSNTVSVETLLYFSSLEIKGFAYISPTPTDDKPSKVVVSLTKDFLQITNALTGMEEEIIEHIQVSKTSLLMDPNKIFKLYIELHDGIQHNLVTKNKKLALSLYKTLHLYIGDATRRKRLHREQSEEEQTVESPIETTQEIQSPIDHSETLDANQNIQKSNESEEVSSTIPVQSTKESAKSHQDSEKSASAKPTDSTAESHQDSGEKGAHTTHMEETQTDTEQK